jgi:purine catabolism regulator
MGYQQATEAMRSSASVAAGSDPVFFDELGLARIVALVAESGRGSEFVDDVLSPVVQDRNGEVLLETLETFLAANCNIAETSKQLHLHYNTVRYRLSRLEGLLGPFVTDAEQRAVLLAACRLRRRLVSS